MDYLTQGYKIVPNEEEQEELKYIPPSLSFQYTVGQSTCAVRVMPYKLTISAAGGGMVSAELYRNYRIRTWVNEYDFVQYAKEEVN